MRRIGIVCAVLCASNFVHSANADATANAAANAVISGLPETAAAPLSTTRKQRTAEYLESVGKSAQSALRAGMPSLAQAIIDDALGIENLSPELENELKLISIDAMIAQGNFKGALKRFDSLKIDKNTVGNKIRGALISIGLSNAEKAMRSLAGIDKSKIAKDELSWYYIALGYIDYELGKIKNALENFAKAKAAATSTLAIADVEIAENFCKLANKEDAASLQLLVDELGEKVKLYMGTPQGFQFVKQYAAALFYLGKWEDALEVLNQQLEIELAPELDKDEIKIIAAAMTKNREKQLSMLRDILRETSSVAICDFALALISKNPDVTSEEQKKFLIELLKKEPNKIRDRIYLELAKVAIKSRNRNEALKYAGKLVEEFPASKYQSDALRILAWAAFDSDSNKEPEYRLAATYLASLADLEQDAEKAREMRLLSADCFYLNKDYATAAKLYVDLFGLMNSKRGVILNRAVESYLLRDEEQNAINLLDSAYDKPGVGDDALWNAEWKIISRFRANGKNEKALERIEHAIKTTRSKSLLIKMQWLLARITEESGDMKKAISQCDNILKQLADDKATDKNTRDIVASNALLMKARCLESLGLTDGDNGAFGVYKILHEKYANTDAAKVSYLYHARTEANRGNFAAAQQLCRTLADADPKGIYAYDAISDAAQYARKLGLEADYKMALTMLDKLCKDFPDNPRNFYARLSQAEILRLLNAFADARKLYEEIINKYSSHPEIHLAWLGLGDCALAQPGKTLNAHAIFERLYALPDMPLAAKAEAAFKCAYALERAGRLREANEMRWVTSEQLLKNDDADAAVKYWIGRNLYALAASLEANGEKRDARAAYELIVKYKLPSYSTAKTKLNKIK